MIYLTMYIEFIKQDMIAVPKNCQAYKFSVIHLLHLSRDEVSYSAIILSSLNEEDQEKYQKEEGMTFYSSSPVS